MSVANFSQIDTSFGTFFGSTLDQSMCEVLAIAKIDRKLLAAESALYSEKWFDYRQLHPTMATYLAAHHYNRAYGDFMGKNLNRGKRFMAGFKGKDVMAAKEVKSFWKLRQMIDERGIPYEFFMRHAMEFCAEHGWLQPPRPQHITTNADLIIEVANQWEMECRSKIPWSQSPRFMVRNWIGAPDQLAYEQQLITRIMQRPNPRFAIQTALYLYDALRIEAAIANLPPLAIMQAIEIETSKSVSADL